jgi:hypothetical protein
MKLPGSSGLFVAGVVVLFTVSFQAGRSGAQCFHDCFNIAPGQCVYSGTSGQILAPSNCILEVWSKTAGTAGSCSGVQTCNATTCVGSGPYCHAPSSGEFAFIGCGSCSGSTTMSGCQACY